MNQLKQDRRHSKMQQGYRRERENTDPVWDIEYQVLKSEAEANSRLRQQISRESYADGVVQVDVREKMAKLKEKAVVLTKSLQQQKRKNMQLQSIIRHINSLRYEQQKIQTAHSDDINYQGLTNLSKRQKKLQYDLQQLINKQNDINSKNKNKKDFINILRIQRVIDSGIFYNIQSEIIELENQYKKFMIHKIVNQYQYNKYIQQYKQLKNNDRQRQQNITKKQNNNKQTNQSQFLNSIPQIQHAIKFIQINQYNKDKIHHQNKCNHQNQNKQLDQEEKEIKVKTIRMETGIYDIGTLINYLNNIDSINHELFQQANNNADHITKLKRKIQKLKQEKTKKTVKYYEKEPSLTKGQSMLKQVQAIESQISKTDVKAQNILTSLKDIMKSDQFKQLVKITKTKISFEEIQSLKSLFSELEIKLNPLLGQVQNGSKDGILTQDKKQKNTQSSREDTLENLINKVGPTTECQKIMKKQEFQKQYNQIRKSQGRQSVVKKIANFRKNR